MSHLLTSKSQSKFRMIQGI